MMNEVHDMNTKLEVGDVFEAPKNMPVYARIPSHFVYVNRPVARFGRQEVTVGEIIRRRDGHTLDLSYLKGRYVVEHARSQGGTGHGSHDSYPDGWHIRARKLNEDGSYNPTGVEIAFYQSGAFTVVNEKVPVVGRLKRVVDFVAV